MARYIALPKSPFSIQGRSNTAFISETQGLLADISKKMAIEPTTSEGRIPSPFSRAEMFRLDLYKSPGDDAEETPETLSTSERAFRGILTVFALRRALSLRVSVKGIELAKYAHDTDGAGRFGRILYDFRESGPGVNPVDFWTSPRYYVIDYKDGTEEVLAGISPLTGLFPAASHPKRLRLFYWYDHTTGKWWDPVFDFLPGIRTGGVQVAQETTNNLAELLRVWVAELLNLPQVEISVAGLQSRHSGFSSSDARDFRRLLERWAQDLELLVGPPRRAVGLIESAIPSAAQSHLKDPRGFAPLEYTLDLQLRDVLNVITDFPCENNKLLIDDVQDTNIRVLGREYGQRELSISRISNAGSDFEALLDGAGVSSELSFVRLDSLFCRQLSCIGQDTRTFDNNVVKPFGLSDGWSVPCLQTSTKREQAKEYDITCKYYLFPFELDILKYATNDELKGTVLTLLADGSIEVKVVVNGRTLRKTYKPQNDEYAIDNTSQRVFDLRSYPALDLRTSGGQSLLSNIAKDQRYFVRVRHNADWTGIRVFGVDDKEELVQMNDEPASTAGQWRPAYHDITASFLLLYGNARPKAIGFANRGFALLSFSNGRFNSNVSPAVWSVAFDFGTSNTCVCIGAGSQRRVLRFNSLTSTLHERPSYPGIGIESRLDKDKSLVYEHASAALDFFGKGAPSKDYFPTQFATLEQQPVATSFRLRNGLIYFENLGVTDNTVGKMINGFDLSDSWQNSVPPKYRFELKTGLKWRDRSHHDPKGGYIYRSSFLWHLYKTIIYTAAAQNARVGSVRCSYPKAMPPSEVDTFRSAIEDIWRNHGQVNLIDNWLLTESEAVCRWLSAVHPGKDHLVLDVGGGTTDVLCVYRKRPFFQSSFRLAGGEVNGFFVRNRAFQSAFLDIFTSKMGVEEGDEKWNFVRVVRQLLEPEDIQQAVDRRLNNQKSETAWFALLQKMDEEAVRRPNIIRDVASGLRNDFDATGKDRAAAAKDASRDFYLTLTLLFSGLAFFGGKLLRLRRETAIDEMNGTDSVQVNNLDIVFVGNAGRFLEFLRADNVRFDGLIKRLLLASSKLGVAEAAIHIVAETQRAKSIIAEGLLCDPPDGSPPAHIPVARFATDTEYYDDIIRKRKPNESGQLVDKHDPPRELPSDIAEFAAALDKELPKGTLSNGGTVVPFMKDSWKSYLGALYEKSWTSIRDAEWDVAEELRKERESEYVGAEDAAIPLFVLRLRAMLENIGDNAG